MGAAPSSGKNNDELIDCLVDNGYIRYRSSEFAFRVVDRGDYFPADKRDNAYKDQAWKSDDGNPGFIHLSAPCIYANALEYLDLRPGMSFLNVGSGSGYFNTICGFLLTETGINHGVEMFDNLIEYSQDILDKVIKRPNMSAFSFCVPEFFNGSAFFIKNGIQYDRIYCGALVPKNRRYYFCNMLKIGGVLVCPYGSRLLRIERKGNNQFCCYQISNVSFSQLIPPSAENSNSTRVCQLPSTEVPPLAQLCRTAIRSHLRKVISQRQSIQMQFESVLAKDTNNEQDDNDEQNSGRIGTLYVMHEHEQQPQRLQAQRQEQNAEQEEALFENPVQANEANETPEEIRDLLQTPPLVDEPVQGNVAEEEEARPRDDFEVWSPQRRQQREQEMEELPHEQQVVEPEQIPLEDGVDAEAAVLQGANQEAENAANNNEEEEQRDALLHQFAVHVNGRQQNANAMAEQLRRQRRQRLHVNLVNGNRLIGFLNAADSDDDEEDREELFREANEQPDVNDPVGLAVYDKNTCAVFHVTDVRPTLDNVPITELVPGYKTDSEKLPTRPKEDGDVCDASTVTDDIRPRQARFALHFALRPVQRGANVQRGIQVHARQHREQPPQPQPSTSTASTGTSNQEMTSASTQTEEVVEPRQQQPQQPARRLVARNVFQGIRQNIDAIQQRQQRIRQLFDRMQRFTNAVPRPAQQNPTQSTAVNAPSSSTATSSSESSTRSGIKRKFEQEAEVKSAADAELQTKSEDESLTSLPKISRSASLPDYSQEQQQMDRVELMSPLIPTQTPQQSQSSSLRPDSPMASSVSAASPLSTVSSENSSIPTTNTASTSGQASDVLSDVASGDLSSIAGGSTSSAPTANVDSQSSDDQQEQNEDDKRQSERAERSRAYKKQIEEFHAEFQHRINSLPISERVARFLSYDE